MQDSRWGLTRAEQRGPSVTLLPMLLGMQPRGVHLPVSQNYEVCWKGKVFAAWISVGKVTWGDLQRQS